MRTSLLKSLNFRLSGKMNREDLTRLDFAYFTSVPSNLLVNEPYSDVKNLPF